MKYTIAGFSQEKLLELNLDPYDVFFLQWYIDFSATGKMNKYIKNGKVFYRVSYTALITEFPFMKITSVRGISKRFDKYVSCGLMEKIVVNTAGGVCAYFALSNVANELIYSPDRSHANESSDGSDATRTTVPVAQKSGGKPESHANESSGGSDATRTTVPVAQKSDDKPENHANKGYDSPKSMLITVPVSCEQPFCCHEKDISEAMRTKVPVAQQPCEQPFRCHANNGSGALNNPSGTIHLLNSSATADPDKEFQQTADSITKALKKQFENINIFSADLVPELVKLLSGKKIDCTEYIDWVIQKCADKKPDNLPGYVYSVITKDYMLAAFILHLQSKDKAAKEKEIVLPHYICPVCGEEVMQYADCPKCGFFYTWRSRPEKIDLQKKVFSLSPEKKKRLKEELEVTGKRYGNDLTHPFEWQKAEKEIYEKYLLA